MHFKYHTFKRKTAHIISIEIPITEENRDFLVSIANIEKRNTNDLTFASFFTAINGLNSVSKGYLLIEIKSYCDSLFMREKVVKEVLDTLNLKLNIPYNYN